MTKKNYELQREAVGAVMRAAKSYFEAEGRPETLYTAITGVWIGYQPEPTGGRGELDNRNVTPFAKPSLTPQWD